MSDDTNEIENAAGRIALQMPTATTGYGFAWETLIVPVVSQLLNCLFHNDDVKPDQVQSRVQTMQARNPQRLQRRATNSALQTARRAGHRISRLEAEQIAKLAIDECLIAPAKAVESAGFAAQSLDTGDDT